jgi:hypothetical protein
LIEKAIVVFILSISFCSSCKSTGTVVSDFGTPNTEYRNQSNEIREGQAELGITGQRIEDRSQYLEQSIKDGAATIQDIRNVLQQVRNQPLRRNEDSTKREARGRGSIKSGES